MFYLRDTNSTNENSFGWWIGIEDTNEDNLHPDCLWESVRDEPSTDEIELQSFNTEDEHCLSYTPERLVRSNQYRIRIPSPRLFLDFDLKTAWYKDEIDHKEQLNTQKFKWRELVNDEQSDVIDSEDNDRMLINKSNNNDVQQLSDKLDWLQTSSRLLYKQIIQLKTNFKNDEWRTDHLTEEVEKLRNEVYELKFLDDLLKLLKGELDNVSNRNWPFAIGHVKTKSDGVNLVI